MKYSALFTILLVSIFLCGCDSDKPSSWLIGSWSCETHEKDKDNFFTFKDNNILDIGEVSKDGTIRNFDLKYTNMIESEDDIIIKVFQDGNDNVMEWLVTFKNKKLINIIDKKNEESIGICRKIK